MTVPSSVDVDLVFLVITVDWHWGIDAHVFTDRDEALRVARATAARRAAAGAEHADGGPVVEVLESQPPGVELYIRYSQDGGEIEDSVWVVGRRMNIPIVDPECDCGG